MVIIHSDRMVLKWEIGTHTVMVNDMVSGHAETFSFGWENNKPTVLDFTESAERWLTDGNI
jgi:hypothetical protein